MSDIQVSALPSTNQKPKCGCDVVLNESYDEPEYEVDNRICLYPAALQAFDLASKEKDEALRLKRKRTQLLLEAKAIIEDLVKESSWMGSDVNKRAEEFLKRIK